MHRDWAHRSRQQLGVWEGLDVELLLFRGGYPEREIKMARKAAGERVGGPARGCFAEAATHDSLTRACSGRKGDMRRRARTKNKSSKNNNNNNNGSRRREEAWSGQAASGAHKRAEGTGSFKLMTERNYSCRASRWHARLVYPLAARSPSSSGMQLVRLHLVALHLVHTIFVWQSWNLLDTARNVLKSEIKT